jgi:hypothetical protein
MAIRATIRSRKREEGFNIDIVAELVCPGASVWQTTGLLPVGEVETIRELVTVQLA